MNPKPSPLSLPEPWELVAEGYAAESAFLMRAFSVAALERIPLANDASVIDVAAGPGTLGLELAARVGHVEAIDFSPRMIDALEQRKRALSITNLHARVADGQALPFDNDRFDAGFSLFGLMFFPERDQGYAELLRVLKPGGVALVSSWAPIEDSPLMALMFGALRAIDPAVPPPKRDPLSLENPDVLASEMTRAGFVDVEVLPCTRSVVIDEAPEVWERMSRSAAPLVLLRRRIGEAAWTSRSPLGVEYIARETGGEPVELSTTAWFGVGKKPA